MDEKTVALTDRAVFPHWKTVDLRFSDTDRQGHVNNAVFATFSEAGRVHLLYESGASLMPPGTELVIARLELDFRAELLWPGRVEIGTAVLGLGRSSFRLGQGIFSGDVCAATAVNVIVLIDSASRRATPLPEPLRAHLRALSAR